MIEMPTPTDHTLQAVAAQLGIGDCTTYECRPLDVDVQAPGTAGLWRARLNGDRGEGTAVVKLLRHPRDWPTLAQLPPDAQTMFIQQFPWSDDPEVVCEVADLCPAGLRTVGLLATQWHGESLRSMWLEDLGEVRTFTAATEFVTAARLLGALAARRDSAGSPLSERFDDSFALTMIARNRVQGGDLPLLAGPLRDVSEDVMPTDLGDDLRWVGEHVDNVLERILQVRHTPVHGDAAPDNVVIDPVDQEAVVLIDLALTPRHALGYDLGQLIFGRHSPVVGMGAGVIDSIVAAYLLGLQDEGMTADLEEVCVGFVGSALIRNAFEVTTATTDRPAKIAAARYLVRRAIDLGLVPARTPVG